MHILFVTGEYPPQMGGVGAYTAELARALCEAGNACTVITGRGGQAQSAAGSDAVRVLPLVDRWTPGAVRTIAQQARALAVDWVHVQYQTAAFGMNPSINFAPRWWRSDLSVAWTYHDLLPPYLFPKAGAALRRWVTEDPARHARAVITTNRADATQLAAGGHEVGRLHTIPIGSNVGGAPLSDGERSARRRRYGWQDGQVALGYFGALNRSKGGATLLKTLAQLVAQGVDAHLLMIGDVLGASDPTNAAYAAEVRNLVDRLGMTARVQWTGRQDAAAVSVDLNAVDVMLLPYADGASLRRGTLMAALANGCAIVTTAPQSPIDELREDEELLYLHTAAASPADHASPADPAGEDAMAEEAVRAVRRLLANPALAARLRANAHRASRSFAWDAIARQHMEIYHTPNLPPR